MAAHERRREVRDEMGDRGSIGERNLGQGEEARGGDEDGTLRLRSGATRSSKFAAPAQVSCWQIVLQKSFSTSDQKFCGS
jgi:hypothetical protein